MRRIITNFPPVNYTTSRSGKCPVCGGRVTRTKTFTMTVSPFNKNPDGTVRTKLEIQDALVAEADEWEPDFTHGRCES